MMLLTPSARYTVFLLFSVVLEPAFGFGQPAADRTCPACESARRQPPVPRSIRNIGYQGSLLKPQAPKRKKRLALKILSLDYDNGVQVRNNRIYFPMMDWAQGQLDLSPSRVKLKLFMQYNSRLELRADRRDVYLGFRMSF